MTEHSGIPDPVRAPELEGLTAREAYWRGKYEECLRLERELIEITRSQLFHAGTDRLTRGMIGAGSSIYYGTDPEILGLGVGVAGVVLGIAGFAAITVTLGAMSLAIGLGGLTVAFVGYWRRTKRVG